MRTSKERWNEKHTLAAGEKQHNTQAITCDDDDLLCCRNDEENHLTTNERGGEADDSKMRKNKHFY